MATCKKCGARKRRWPRSCPTCRAGSYRADAAVLGANVSVAAGLFGGIRRAVTGLVRRIIDWT
ncbi:hypothetical protein SXIM_02630 [Streptomyces xiamenensis]|uniref:Uncharacterized protein n=1 Tax=Streptomyces xiamenensis TaxID=408015 RepID=A0A0F7FQB9_9ACTN|nr:hypothetical protein SXIM_02630 [Streptomyces xiamenensis]